MSQPRRSRVPRRGPFALSRARQRGSTLLLVMMVVLIVSLLGASLLFVTQLEREIGEASRQLTQSDHVAESGQHAAIGAVMVSQDWSGERFAVVERQVGNPSLGGVSIGQRVQTTRVQAMGPPKPPPLTVANEGEDRYHTFTVILDTTAERVTWPASAPVPFYDDPTAERQNVEVMARSVQTVSFFLSPIPRPVSGGEIYNADGKVEIE